MQTLKFRSWKDSNLQMALSQIFYHDLPKIDDFCNFSSYQSFAGFQHGSHCYPEIRKAKSKRKQNQVHNTTYDLCNFEKIATFRIFARNQSTYLIC